MQLRGNFNPLIFQPPWLAREGLISDEAARAADLKVAHPQVVDFGLGWANVQVTQDAFIASADSGADFDRMRDLVHGMFAVLRHTPVTRAMLAFSSHHRCASEDEATAVVRLLGRTQTIAKIVPDAEPQALQFSMPVSPAEGGPFAARTRGMIIEPSRIHPPGIFFNVFEGFGFEPQPGQATEEHVGDAEGLIDCLDREWEPARQATRALTTQVLAAALKEQAE